MTAKSDYLEDAILNAVLRNVSYTSPTTVYVALFTTATSDAGGGTEVPNSNGYGRTAITFSAPSPSGTITSSADCTFPQASGGNWGTITHFAIVDSATHGGGNFLYHGAFSSSKTIDDGDTFKIPAGDMDITEA